MLYTMHEMSHAALAPWQMWARMNVGLFSHPFSSVSYSPLARTIAAGNELFVRITQRYAKPRFGISQTVIDGAAVPIDKVVALDKPFCRLLHFRRDTGRRDPKVLLVAPLSGHHATLLRDTVCTLLSDHDVYLTDWVDARMVPLANGAFHLDDYVDYVREFIRFLGPEVHVISVCQSTVPVLAAVALMADADERDTPRSMILMGGPIDARRTPTAVSDLPLRKPLSWFRDNVIQRVPSKYPGFMRLVYPGFLQHLGFVAMNPARHANAHRDFYNHLLNGDGESAEAHRRFYDEYNAVLDMPAEYYLETVKTVFQEFALPEGCMTVRGQPVRPQAIRRTALMTIEGKRDDICGKGQTEAAHELCTGIAPKHREHYVAQDVGHYGIFSGRRFRDATYPRIHDFIKRKSTPLPSGRHAADRARQSMGRASGRA